MNTIILEEESFESNIKRKLYWEMSYEWTICWE